MIDLDEIEESVTVAQFIEFDEEVTKKWKYNEWWCVETVESGGVIAMFSELEHAQKFRDLLITSKILENT